MRVPPWCSPSRPWSHLCVAVCCSVLQCVAVFGSVLQCFAVCCSVLHYIGIWSMRVSLSSGACTPCTSWSYLENIYICMYVLRVCVYVYIYRVDMEHASCTLVQFLQPLQILVTPREYMYYYVYIVCGVCVFVCVCRLVQNDTHLMSCSQVVCIHTHTHTHKHTILQHTATYCNMQHTEADCNRLHHTTTHCSTLQHTAKHYNTLQHTATHCNTPHHTATHCNIRI